MEFIFLLLPAINYLWCSVINQRGDAQLNGAFATAISFLMVFMAGIFFQRILLLSEIKIVVFGHWINLESVKVPWTFTLSPVTGIMYLLVTSVSALVHLYSLTYMEKDERLSVFMGYLSLFTFTMLLLVSGDNLVQIFLGWEGVGLCSYLLIGFWYKREKASAAAVKAFIMNRVGDIGFIVALGLIYSTFKTLNISELYAQIRSAEDFTLSLFTINVSYLELCAFMVLLAAIGKSAQLGLHTWLPDAMEGPTPVSALIHAATMVTAGVFLLIRMNFLISQAPYMMNTTIWIGLLTALFGGSMAMIQNDIKRVIAYSTCSQLGLMMMAVGVGAFHVALFHIFIHGFFKALLFLGAGAVIHGLSGEQDMRNMGGLYKVLPFTYAMMLIGTGAIIGVPGLSGFYSKEAIYESLFFVKNEGQKLIFLYGFLASIGLTVLYSLRMILLTFHGPTRVQETVLGLAHEPSTKMFLSLVILSVLSIFLGFGVKEYFMHSSSQLFCHLQMTFDHGTISAAYRYLPMLMLASALVVGIFMFNLLPSITRLMVYRLRFFYIFLINRGYFDYIYDELIVKAVTRVGCFFREKIDILFVDNFLIRGSVRLLEVMSNILKRRHSGFLSDYLMYMLVVVSIVLFIQLLWMVRGMRL